MAQEQLSLKEIFQKSCKLYECIRCGEIQFGNKQCRECQEETTHIQFWGFGFPNSDEYLNEKIWHQILQNQEDAEKWRKKNHELNS